MKQHKLSAAEQRVRDAAAREMQALLFNGMPLKGTRNGQQQWINQVAACVDTPSAIGLEIVKLRRTPEGAAMDIYVRHRWGNVDYIGRMVVQPTLEPEAAPAPGPMPDNVVPFRRRFPHPDELTPEEEAEVVEEMEAGWHSEEE